MNLESNYMRSLQNKLLLIIFQYIFPVSMQRFPSTEYEKYYYSFMIESDCIILKRTWYTNKVTEWNIKLQQWKIHVNPEILISFWAAQ